MSKVLLVTGGATGIGAAVATLGAKGAGPSQFAMSMKVLAAHWRSS